MKRLVISLALLAPLACDKDKKPSDVPDADTTGDVTVADTGGEDEPKEPIEPDVPQEPDPAEIAEGAHEYLLGHYQQAIDKLEPVYNDLEERKQYRASGLAGGWLALAHAQIVFESGQEPSKHALEMADRTQDPEVKAVAQLAHGAMLLGNEDYEAAAAAFTNAANAAPESLPGALANILRAESLIGSAFGTSASETVENPADLEEAKKAYAAAAKVANAGKETDALMGRVEEGLAAVSRYQGDKPAVCSHAAASIEHFQKAGVSEFLVDGPRGLADKFGCKL
ncbi:MAG: hypothetical protein ACE37F_34685 [Nannocystaceae bacterium]|nr:hypothetical protein [bacterium]